jgi:hypothetical protein
LLILILLIHLENWKISTEYFFNTVKKISSVFFNINGIDDRMVLSLKIYSLRFFILLAIMWYCHWKFIRWDFSFCWQLCRLRWIISMKLLIKYSVGISNNIFVFFLLINSAFSELQCFLHCNLLRPQILHLFQIMHTQTWLVFYIV